MVTTFMAAVVGCLLGGVATNLRFLVSGYTVMVIRLQAGGWVVFYRVGGRVVRRQTVNLLYISVGSIPTLPRILCVWHTVLAVILLGIIVMCDIYEVMTWLPFVMYRR